MRANRAISVSASAVRPRAQSAWMRAGGPLFFEHPVAEPALVFIECLEGAFRSATVQVGLRPRQNRDFLGQRIAHRRVRGPDAAGFACLAGGTRSLERTPMARQPPRKARPQAPRRAHGAGQNLVARRSGRKASQSTPTTTASPNTVSADPLDQNRANPWPIGGYRHPARRLPRHAPAVRRARARGLRRSRWYAPSPHKRAPGFGTQVQHGRPFVGRCVERAPR